MNTPNPPSLPPKPPKNTPPTKTPTYISPNLPTQPTTPIPIPIPRIPKTAYSSFCATIPLKGPFLTIKLMTSYSASAAAMVVSSAFVSYAGATSTISAAIKLMPSRPRMMVRSSRVDQPPVSGVPVAGATIRGKWGLLDCEDK